MGQTVATGKAHSKMFGSCSQSSALAPLLIPSEIPAIELSSRIKFYILYVNMMKKGALFSCLLALLALVYMTAGANAATCKTNGGSPTVGDANNAVNYLKNKGNVGCCQTKCSGDYCTQMIDYGSARARICGGCNQCIPCSSAGNALGNVVNQCTQNGLVAGSEFASNFEFQIIHT